MTPSKKTTHPYWTTTGQLERTIADLDRLSKRLKKLMPTIERGENAIAEQEKSFMSEDIGEDNSE